MKPKTIALAAMIGAVYAALTLAVYPLSFGPVQLRFAEALTVLPLVFPPAAWGLFVGCVIANIFGGLGPIDVVFGSLATLAAGVLTARVRVKWLAPLPPIIVNALVIGAVLTFTVPDAPEAPFFLFAGQVAAGQVAACAGLGLPLLLLVERTGLFRKHAAQ